VDLKKRLRVLYTNGEHDKFIALLDKMWQPMKGGLADGKYPHDFDPRQLVMGIKVEFEHTSDIVKAAKIAMDHLAEIGDYYTRLKGMEAEAEMEKTVEHKANIIRRPAMFKHLAAIQGEFLRIARDWNEMPLEWQRGYLTRHPGSRRRLTGKPTPRSETSGLMIVDPKRSQSREILDILRKTLNAATDVPVFRKYLTKREGTANKYHYFAVFPDKDGNFAAANVYGRIGYPPRGIKVLETSPNKDVAIQAAEDKIERKMTKKHYQPTAL